MTRLTLYSSHDIALTALFKALNMPKKYQEEHPDYGCMVRMELYRKEDPNKPIVYDKSLRDDYGEHYLKVYINKDLIGTYDYKKFQAIANPYRTDESMRSSWCNTLLHHKS